MFAIFFIIGLRRAGIENWVKYTILRVRMSLSLCASESQDSEGIKIVSAISTFVLKDTCTSTFSLHFSAKMLQLCFGLTRYNQGSYRVFNSWKSLEICPAIWTGKSLENGDKVWKNGKKSWVFLQSFFVLIKSYSISLIRLQRIIKKASRPAFF